jgi:hypothetical protein
MKNGIGRFVLPSSLHVPDGATFFLALGDPSEIINRSVATLPDEELMSLMDAINKEFQDRAKVIEA